MYVVCCWGGAAPPPTPPRTPAPAMKSHFKVSPLWQNYPPFSVARQQPQAPSAKATTNNRQKHEPKQAHKQETKQRVEIVRLQHLRLPRTPIFWSTPCGKTTHYTRSLGPPSNKPTKRHQSTKTNSNENNRKRIQQKPQETTNQNMNQHHRPSNQPSNVLTLVRAPQSLSVSLH